MTENMSRIYAAEYFATDATEMGPNRTNTPHATDPLPTEVMRSFTSVTNDCFFFITLL